jgi:pyruvate kinase
MLMPAGGDQKGMLVAAELKLLEMGLVHPGDLIVMTVGDTMGQMGGTNTLKILRVTGQV